MIDGRSSRNAPLAPGLPLAAALLVLAVSSSGPRAAEGGPARAPDAAPTPGTTATAAAAPAPPRRNIGGPGDYALRERLVATISKDPELAKERSSLVLVNGGAVFSGTVTSCALKTRLLLVAATEIGIINITDETEVPRGSVDDVALGVAVENLLKDQAEPLGLRDLAVSVDDGAVTLAGTVKSYFDRVRAEGLAGSVLGVRRIANHLIPADAPAGADDEAITRALVGYLSDFRQYGFPADLKVKTEGGVVTLTGQVGLYLARQQAATLAALVGGVKSVNNRIEFDWSLNTGRRTIVQPVR